MLWEASPGRKDGVCGSGERQEKLLLRQTFLVFCFQAPWAGTEIARRTGVGGSRQNSALPGNFPTSCTFCFSPQPRRLPLTWQVWDDPVLRVDVPGFNGEHLLQRFLWSGARYSCEGGTGGTPIAPVPLPAGTYWLDPMPPHQETCQGSIELVAPHFKGQGDRSRGTQEPLLTQVCFGAILAGIHPPASSPPKPSCTGPGAGARPGTTHVELVYLCKPAVDELFREVVPLHQEHVDLRGKAEAMQPYGRAGPLTLLRLKLPGSLTDGSISDKWRVFLPPPQCE